MTTELDRLREEYAAFRQHVSDTARLVVDACRHEVEFPALERLIIPDPDPLVEVIAELRPWDTSYQWNNEVFTKRLREALDRRGLEIASKDKSNG